MSNKTTAEMVGEGFRECGVLLAVFGMLDKFLRSEGPTLVWSVWVLGLAVTFFATGCMIERKRGQ